MCLLRLHQGNLKVAEDSYMTGRERNKGKKKKQHIQKAIHLKEKRNSAKVNSIIHQGNRIAKENL